MFSKKNTVHKVPFGSWFREKHIWDDRITVTLPRCYQDDEVYSLLHNLAEDSMSVIMFLPRSLTEKTQDVIFRPGRFHALDIIEEKLKEMNIE